MPKKTKWKGLRKIIDMYKIKRETKKFKEVFKALAKD